MTKKEFVEKYAEMVGVTQVQAKREIGNMEQIIPKLLVEGEEIPLTGIGIFKVVKTPERIGRNPKTGEEITIPERAVPKIKISSVLKKKILEEVNVDDIK